MTQHFPLDYGDVVHQGFFDPIQELLGASLPSLRIKVHNSSTLRILAGSGNEQAAAAIMGKYRFLTSDFDATLPGSLTNGTGLVFITASDNNFTGGPTGPPDVSTNYGFAMEVRASGTPSTTLYRKVGEVDVVGGNIKSFRPMGGPRPTGEFGIVATPDEASQPGVLVRGLASQTGSLIEAQNSGATAVYSVSNTGSTVQSGGITTSSSDGVTVSGNGGKDTLNLSNDGSNTGITIGGDVEIYRAAANSIQTDDSVTIRRSTSTATTLATRVTTDSEDRVSITAGGNIQLGSGSASPDARLRRSAANTLIIDTPTDGSAALSVTGALTVGGTVTLTSATTTGHLLISDGSGLMSLGTANTASITNDAITADKLRDDGSTDSNRAVTTNHIRNSAITTEKLNDDSVTASKLRDDASTDSNRAVTTDHIRNSAITSAKIEDGTIVDGDISGTAAIAESKLSLQVGSASTASIRALGTTSTTACAGNDSRLSNSRTPSGTAGGDLAGSYPDPTIRASVVSSTAGNPVDAPVGATAVTDINARKYADGLVVLSGQTLYASWPGYFFSQTVSGQSHTVLELGYLPSGYRPVADLITTGTARGSSSLLYTTFVIVTTGGGIFARLSGADSGTPVRWRVDGITFHAG